MERWKRLDLLADKNVVGHGFDPATFNFAERPFIVIWEVTRACELACRHCRAAAVVKRHPSELKGDEVLKFLDQVAELNPALFVLTGGDPLMRSDLYEMIEQAGKRGLRVSISPSGTSRLNKDSIVQLKHSGVVRIALSLDAPDAQRHDTFRGVAGAFERTLEAIHEAKRIGLGFQLHSTLCEETVSWFNEMPDFVRGLEPSLWSLFFLIPVGRGVRLHSLDAPATEKILNQIYEFSLTVPFDVKTTEAPQYRRVALQCGAEHVFARQGFSKRGIPSGINDGKGFVFVSHLGEVYPSGFLYQSCGNVRKTSLKTAYCNHALMKSLRDPDLFKGKCGRCNYRRICGGSRARAWAVTGDALGEDPTCSYQPVPGLEVVSL